MSEHETKATPPSALHAAPAGHHEKLHVTWDEETIAEHDLLRGTRQKIDEPNTPFHYYAAHEEAAADGGVPVEPVSPARSLSGREGAPTLEWGELQSKLRGVEQRANELDSSSDDEGGAHFAERDAEGKKLEKDPEFATKRKKHYNEFERVKAWRQAHATDEDDEDEEDEHEEKKSRKDE